MNILWITWKDIRHPDAGGAEIVCHELCKRMVADGHHVTLLTTDYPGAKKEAEIPGVEIIRVGSSRYTHPFKALWYYIRHLRNKFDAVIEEVNGGAPYFAVFFGRPQRSAPAIQHQHKKKMQPQHQQQRRQEIQYSLSCLLYDL